MPAAPAIDPAVAGRAALALVVFAAAWMALRAAAAFDPGMRAWGVNDLRFAAPWFGWLPWGLAAIVFLPPVARAIAPHLEAFGEAAARRRLRPLAGFAAVVAALVLAFPDRLWLMGDFLIRYGCTRGQIPTSLVFPQALPFDLFVHHEVPVALVRAGIPDPSYWERAIGAVEAAGFALAALAFGRAFGLRGVALAVAAGTIVGSGALSMFTGYGKGFVELTLATVVSAAFAMRVVRAGRGAWGLAAAITAGILFHRSALALLLPLAVTAVLWWRSHGRREPSRRTATAAAFGLPIVAAVATSPQLLAAMKVTDLRHVAPQGAGAAEILGAAFSAGHLRDVLNRVAEGAPFAFAIPVLAVLLAPALRARGRELALLASFALPALVVLLFVHPRQGVFRDADVFTPSLAALTLVAAALAGEALRGAPARAWAGAAALAAALAVVVPSRSLAADVTRGLARVQAYLEGPPKAADEERALLWAYVAERRLGLRDVDGGVAAFEKAAELAPSPRILTELALAELDRRNYRGAQEAYARAVVRAPGYTEGWLGLADASIGAKDWGAVEHALQQASRLEPGRPEIAMIRRAYEKARAMEAQAP